MDLNGNKYNNFKRAKMLKPTTGTKQTKQIVKSKQKLIQDLNFSNEIFFGMLSTLQSIYLFDIGKHSSEYDNKMFGKYDQVNYKDKTLPELKSQLQTQIFIFQASRQVFNMQNNENQWNLPHNFPEQHAKQIILKALHTFEQVKDIESVKMTKDIIKLLEGQLEGLNAESIKIDLVYTPEVKKKFNDNLIKNGVEASRQMEDRLKEVENFKSQDQITAKINPNSRLFTQQPVEQITNPIEEKPNNQEIFLAFQQNKQESIKKCLEQKLEITELLHTCSCNIFEDKNEVQQNINTLITTRYTQMVSVVLDSKNRIQSWGEISQLSLKDAKSKKDIESNQQEIDLKMRNYSVFYAIYTQDFKLEELLKKPFNTFYQEWKKSDNTVQIFKILDKKFYDQVSKMYKAKAEPKGIKLTQIRGKIEDIVSLTFSIGTNKISGEKNYLPFEDSSVK